LISIKKTHLTMKMNDYISSFTDQLREAIRIGETSSFKAAENKIKNILICGLGGSGIGGSILSDVLSSEITIPISCSKDYSIPNFVNKNTLVIASSYSGNTEETLSALELCISKGAEIAIVTSAGKLKSIAEENNINHIIIPGGQPPRAMFAYSFTQLFYIFQHYNLINSDFKNSLKNSISLLDSQAEKIKTEAKNLAKSLYKKTPVIYVASGYEGVAIRFRQQLNENSKCLCWHHVVPEMNHNELLGWRTNTENLAVIFLRNKSDLKRNQVRMDINKTVISEFTNDIFDIYSQGNSNLENSLYLINFGDWVSWFLSELNEVDAIEIDVINFLKDKLANIK
jgi:glucose/mannose-6-phosphate isomerase